MTTRKPQTEETTWTVPADMATSSKAATYVAGSHSARVRTEHDQRRAELLARDEILAGEIDRRQAERHDINEALSLMSAPAPVLSNVVPIAAQ